MRLPLCWVTLPHLPDTICKRNEIARLLTPNLLINYQILKCLKMVLLHCQFITWLPLNFCQYRRLSRNFLINHYMIGQSTNSVIIHMNKWLCNRHVDQWDLDSCGEWFLPKTQMSQNSQWFETATMIVEKLAADSGMSQLICQLA